MPRLSIVIPIYNEAAVLRLLEARLRPVVDGMGMTYEVVAVDDGSTDETPAVLTGLRRDWPQLRIIRLRANAGHQAALSAGLNRATGDYVVSMDADLQDPPETIPAMVAAADEGALDVVYGVREDRSTDSVFKRWSARVFYRLIRTLGSTSAAPHAGDFRLMSRATVDAVNSLPETNRVLRFVVPALGFPSGRVGYSREKRAAGRSKYPLSTMIRLSIDSLTGSSIRPLRAATWFGLVGGVVALGVLAYALIALAVGAALPGWTSTVVIVAFFGAVQLLSLGILGEYVGRTYEMLQARPAYFIASDTADESGAAGSR